MPRQAWGTIQSRAWRLLCPRCGNGPLFAAWFRMHERCSGCGLKFERDPGYFLGSTYINYALTAGMMSVAYLVLHFGFGVSNRVLTWPLMAFCVLFPLAFFRYARSLWLAMDCYWDSSGFEREDEREPDDEES